MHVITSYNQDSTSSALFNGIGYGNKILTRNDCTHEPGNIEFYYLENI